MIPHIQIEVDASGRGSIKVDEQELPGVGSMNIRIRAGKLTRVVVLMAADVAVTGDGIVTEHCIDGSSTKRRV